MRVIRFISEQELLSNLKHTQLMGHGQPFIYHTAHLSLQEKVNPYELIPAQRYVLESDFQRIEYLYQNFLQQGIDIFSLKGGIWFNMGEESIPLTPPIVEESWEAQGRKIWLISDGMHRVYTARQLGKPITIILVQNVPREYPYYAYPLEGGWNEVTELKELIEGFQKKNYREKQYKNLFRNYNAVFPGIQKSRNQVRLKGS